MNMQRLIVLLLTLLAVTLVSCAPISQYTGIKRAIC